MIRLGVLVVVCGGALLLMAGLSTFRSFTISTASMAPTLRKGDYVIASGLAYAAGRQPRRGDLVVFRQRRDGGSTYIKRLIGLPGDRVRLASGVIYLNDRAVARQSLGPVTEAGTFGMVQTVQRYRETLPGGRSYEIRTYGPDGPAETTGVYAVPAGRFFVLADNRDAALDSRYPDALGGGYVPYEDLVGRAEIAISTRGQDADGQPRRLVNVLK